jgi:cellobiose-specific phosphotransferase system component IIB
MHYRVQERPGENVYLFCKMGYTTGMFIEEIDKVTAENLMDKFKFMEISVNDNKTKINYKDYYDKLYQ